jgi:hypothetical protein
MEKTKLSESSCCKYYDPFRKRMYIFSKTIYRAAAKH